MTYSEEEITPYTNILQNLNNGLDVYTPVLIITFHSKFQKRFHVKIAVIHIFSKIMVSVTVTNVFILLAVFLSKILLLKTAVIFRRKVFTRGHIIIKVR